MAKTDDLFFHRFILFSNTLYIDGSYEHIALILFLWMWLLQDDGTVNYLEFGLVVTINKTQMTGFLSRKFISLTQ